MEFDDFKTWMRATQDSFPSLRQWMIGQPEGGKSLWKTWRQALGGVSLDAATAAVQKMLETTIPYRWDQLPGIVIGLCVSGSSKPKGDRRCICNGDGIVEVGVLYQAKTFDGNPLPIIWVRGQQACGPIGAACLCPVGKWINVCRERKFDSAIGPRMLPVYDPKKMIVCSRADTVFAEQIEREERTILNQACQAFEDGDSAVRTRGTTVRAVVQSVARNLTPPKLTIVDGMEQELDLQF